MKEEHCRFFYQQIILALDYCHKMSISNRDIKLENTLLDSTRPDRNPLIKLCDFGYSINDSHSLPKTAVGTPGYTGASAPPVHACMHACMGTTEGVLNLACPSAALLAASDLHACILLHPGASLRGDSLQL